MAESVGGGNNRRAGDLTGRPSTNRFSAGITKISRKGVTVKTPTVSPIHQFENCTQDFAVWNSAGQGGTRNGKYGQQP